MTPAPQSALRSDARLKEKVRGSARTILQIAAIALYHNLTVVTHNTREFGRISSLRLED